MELRDLKVIVTGAAQGMGAHFSKAFAEAGAQVAAGDVNEAALAALPKGIHRRRLDVADEEGVKAFVAWAAGAMGGVNALVNNAGILRDGLLVRQDKVTGEVTALSRADWDAVRFIVECDYFNGRCVDVDGGLAM
jgi:3-oxoacyl-[acyl-carrier protein] reductase